MTFATAGPGDQSAAFAYVHLAAGRGGRHEGARKPETARAALIDETALLEGLRSGHIGHAGLDVFHIEPLKPDHPLAGMENVTLTAHAGFRTLEASMTLLRRAIDIVRDIGGNRQS